MTWFWLVLLMLICVAVGFYVYLAEYRETDSDDPELPSLPGTDENRALADDPHRVDSSDVREWTSIGSIR
jgi:hypothetical protein